MESFAIGIDLGTTYSCVSVFKNNHIEVIPNNLGERLTPSYISILKDNLVLIGSASKNIQSKNIKNTFFDVKRIIGRKYNSNEIKKCINYFPYELIEDKNGYVNIKCSVQNTVQHTQNNIIGEYKPEEISAKLLIYLKNIASDYLGSEIKDVVITVPAYFNDSQRISTRQAGKLANLNVLRIINEPTSAALAYGYGNIDKETEKEKIILVIDIGGGTTDLSILEIDNNIIEVIAVSGDTFFGGQDFNNILVNYCIEDFEKQNNIDINSLKSQKRTKIIERIKANCEKIKIQLSSIHIVETCIDSLFNEIDFSINITRSKFNKLCKNEFNKIINLLEKLLKDSGKSKSEIDEIILVGGSTRIPKLQEMISKFFDNKKLNKTLNPDEAISHGAALQAYYLTRDISIDNQILLIDVIPLSLGIETSGGIMEVLIPRNSVKPISETQIFSTDVDNQSAVTIKIYEGERPLTVNNHLLGKFNLNVELASKGVPKVEVTFYVDENGILTVSAIDLSTNEKKSFIIENSEYLSSQDIEKILENSEKMKKGDNIQKKIIQMKEELETITFLCDSKNNKDIEIVINSDTFIEEIDILTQTIDSLTKWLEKNKISESHIVPSSMQPDTKQFEKYENKLNEINLIVNPIMEKIYKNIY